jgi:hypothetical protein
MSFSWFKTACLTTFLSINAYSSPHEIIVSNGDDHGISAVFAEIIQNKPMISVFSCAEGRKPATLADANRDCKNNKVSIAENDFKSFIEVSISNATDQDYAVKSKARDVYKQYKVTLDNLRLDSSKPKEFDQSKAAIQIKKAMADKEKIFKGYSFEPSAEARKEALSVLAKIKSGNSYSWNKVSDSPFVRPALANALSSLHALYYSLKFSNAFEEWAKKIKHNEDTDAYNYKNCYLLTPGYSDERARWTIGKRFSKGETLRDNAKISLHLIIERSGLAHTARGYEEYATVGPKTQAEFFKSIESLCAPNK